MVGADGNDYYIVDNLGDLVVEDAGVGTGTDSVVSKVLFHALAENIEVLILSTGGVSGVGNGLENTLIGNSSNNSLNGGGGNDWLFGVGGNNTLNGGAGEDTMVGGVGNDYFLVDHAGDSLAGGGGQDGVITLLEGYTLPDAFNILVLGTGVLEATGNSGNNTITGNSLANTLDGGGGEDVLAGGVANDYYLVDSAGDTVVESLLEGTDTVESFISSYTLPNNVERLILGAGAVDGVGNSLSNTLTGNSSANSLFGAAGKDLLIGGDGNDTLSGASTSNRNEIDTLTGGAGNDLFVLGNASTVFYNDAYTSQVGVTDYAYITDFTPGADQLQLRGVAASYYLGSHTVTALSAHQGLFLEAGSTDELVAIIATAGAALSAANTIEAARFV
jgi:Ca2+-binding RTX toxin-like protein